MVVMVVVGTNNPARVGRAEHKSLRLPLLRCNSPLVFVMRPCCPSGSNRRRRSGALPRTLEPQRRAGANVPVAPSSAFWWQST